MKEVTLTIKPKVDHNDMNFGAWRRVHMDTAAAHKHGMVNANVTVMAAIDGGSMQPVTVKQYEWDDQHAVATVTIEVHDHGHSHPHG